MTDSAMPGFYQKSRDERIGLVRDFAGLSDAECDTLYDASGGLSYGAADRMTENAVGTFSLPLGIATNFRINGRDYLVPMVTEEPSVVAAASKGAKTARIRGGFAADADKSYMTGQVQILHAGASAVQDVQAASDEILRTANSQSRTLSGMGAGARNVSCRTVRTDSGPMLVAELLVDVADAMGANVTNSMCEAVAPLLESITGGTALLRILSNHSTRRMARASAVFDARAVGEDTVDAIILAYQLAKHDVYRAVTHNKGVMNGIAAVSSATGQDTRAIDASAHAHAARTGSYSSLTEWSRDPDGNLVGRLELPLAVGTVGGITRVHPTAKLCMRILGVSSAQELACVIASVGLAQNYSALRALCTEGIQRGHMRLHARNLAAAAGATGAQTDRIVRIMIERDDISLDAARRLLAEYST